MNRSNTLFSNDHSHDFSSTHALKTVLYICFGKIDSDSKQRCLKNRFHHLADNIELYLQVIDCICSTIKNQRYNRFDCLVQSFYKKLDIEQICNTMIQSKQLSSSLLHRIIQITKCMLLVCSYNGTNLESAQKTLIDVFTCLISMLYDANLDENCMIQMESFEVSYIEQMYALFVELNRMKKQKTNDNFYSICKYSIMSHIKWYLNCTKHLVKEKITNSRIFTMTKLQESNLDILRKNDTSIELWLCMSMWMSPFVPKEHFNYGTLKKNTIFNIQKNIQWLNSLTECYDYDHIVKKVNVDLYIEYCLLFLVRVNINLNEPNTTVEKYFNTVCKTIDFISKWNKKTEQTIESSIKFQNRCYNVFKLISILPENKQKEFQMKIHSNIIHKTEKEKARPVSFFSKKRPSNISLISTNRSETSPIIQNTNTSMTLSDTDCVPMIGRGVFLMKLIEHMNHTQSKNKQMNYSKRNNSKKPTNIKLLIAQYTCKAEMFDL